MAAATISAVAVVCMVAAGGSRRPLTFAGSILLPDNHAASSAPAPATRRPSASPSPTAVRSAAPVLAGPSRYQPPVAPALPAAPPAWSGSPAPAATSRSAAPATSSRTPTPHPTVPAKPQGEPIPDALAQALVTALNDARHQAGLAALAWDGRLQRIAIGHNQAMARANLLTARVGTEPALGVRQANQGVLGEYAAEVEGRANQTGTAGALAVLRSMLSEQAPDSRHSLLSGGVNSVGVDVLADPARGQLWITLDVAQLP